jgi:hypothetical protein
MPKIEWGVLAILCDEDDFATKSVIMLWERRAAQASN